MPSLPQSLLVRLGSLGTHPKKSELEDRGQENEWSPHNPGGNSRPPPRPLWPTQVYGARWDPPRGTGGAHRSAHQATFKYLPAILVNWEGPGWLDIDKTDAPLQEGSEEGPRELQTNWSWSREGHGPDHLECHPILSAVRQSRGSGPASMSSMLGKAGPAWPAWSPSTTWRTTEMRRERLWMLSSWLSVKPLTAFPTVPFSTNQLFTTWMGHSFLG